MEFKQRQLTQIRKEIVSLQKRARELEKELVNQ